MRITGRTEDGGRERGRPPLQHTRDLGGALPGFSLGPAECLVNTSTALTPSAAAPWLRPRDPWPSLPVLRVSRGQTPGDKAHLEGDVLPISVEGAGLGGRQGVGGPGPEARGFGRRRFPADLRHRGALLHIGGGFSHVFHCKETDNNGAFKARQGEFLESLIVFLKLALDELLIPNLLISEQDSQVLFLSEQFFCYLNSIPKWYLFIYF